MTYWLILDREQVCYFSGMKKKKNLIRYLCHVPHYASSKDTEAFANEIEFKIEELL